MSSSLTKEERLERINGFLDEYGQAPWTIERIGDVRKGECEILDVKDCREIGPKRIELVFRTIDPAGNERDIGIRFGGRLIYVMPLLSLTGESDRDGAQVCLAKRWRYEMPKRESVIPIDNWSYELPHGLVYDDEHEGPTHPLESACHVQLRRTFGPDCTEFLTVAQIIPIRTFLVNGEDRPAEAYLFVSQVLKPFRRRLGEGDTVMLTWPQVMSLVRTGKGIVDAHTVAILFSAGAKFKYGE